MNRRQTAERLLGINPNFDVKDWFNLTRANLTWTNLAGTDLTGANLTEANLTEANLTGANLTEANLTEANLTGANLTGANLAGVIGLVNINFSGFPMYIQLEKSKIGCQYRPNVEWEQMTIEQAVKFGIEREHFEVYRKFYDAAMFFLRGQK